MLRIRTAFLNFYFMTDLFVTSDAIFSNDRKYRYALIRVWDDEKPKIAFIGLNPSTANETDNDPTIRRVMRFAKDWGYGGVYMLNLFAVVSADPKVLVTCPDPIGDNDKWLELFCGISHKLLFAWGGFKEAKQRAKEVSSKFTLALCLGKNADGSPKHPLYIKADTKPVQYI